MKTKILSILGFLLVWAAAFASAGHGRRCREHDLG